jgi:hypothetical protein
MPVQLTLLVYCVLILALALMVRWEGIRRRQGPSLKPGDLHQLNSARLPYTPPPDRSKRSLDAVRR